MSWNTLLGEKCGHTECITLKPPRRSQFGFDRDNARAVVTVSGSEGRSGRLDQHHQRRGRKALCADVNANVIEGAMHNGQPTGLDKGRSRATVRAVYLSSKSGIIALFRNRLQLS
jgi:hypothetical protein